MFARVSTFQGSPDAVDEGIRALREEVFPEAKQLPGFAGLLVLVDRDSGKSLGVTLWQTEQAMRDSEEAGNQLRDHTAQIGGGRIASVERFELALLELAK